MSIDVQLASIKDLHLIVDLFDEYRIFYKQPSDKTKAEKFLFDRFEHAESITFVAVENDRPVGFTQLYPIFSSVSMERVWLLNDLFVVSSHRKKGIAEKLLSAAKEFAISTKAKGLELSTAINNTSAQRLYERLGYKKEDGYLHYFLSL